MLLNLFSKIDNTEGFNAWMAPLEWNKVFRPTVSSPEVFSFRSSHTHARNTPGPFQVARCALRFNKVGVLWQESRADDVPRRT